MEAARLTYSLKDKQRCSDANQRLQQLNDSFVKDVEKKLVEKMEMTSEKKNMRINSLRDRLKEHVIFIIFLYLQYAALRLLYSQFAKGSQLSA